MLEVVDMIDCISIANMRESDKYTIENFVPSLELMHRAAYGVFLSANWEGQRIGILAGSGNNGGDGFALACILRQQGYDCTVFTVSNHFSPDSMYYAKKASHMGIIVLNYCTGCLKDYDLLVDCLLGTGFQGSVRSDYSAVIKEINEANAFVISVDINSGMNGDTGNCEIAVKSDLTVTIGFVKKGLIVPHAGHFMKRLVCVDIGIFLLKKEDTIYSQEEWYSLSGEKCSGILCPEWLDMTILKAY